MEHFWQLLLDISANHINRYGLYIPGDPYRLDRIIDIRSIDDDSGKKRSLCIPLCPLSH